MTQRRLIVMRHAKAEQFAASDRERGLTRAGHEDARAAGEYLAAAQMVPDHAVVSTAVRTRATWEEIVAVTGSTVTPVFEEALYGGSPERVLEVLHVVPEEARTVLYVGHNPAAEYLAHVLDDGTGDPEAVTRMLAGFPTAALAVLEVDVPWAELGEGAARVRAFHVARG